VPWGVPVRGDIGTPRIQPQLWDRCLSYDICLAGTKQATCLWSEMHWFELAGDKVRCMMCDVDIQRQLVGGITQNPLPVIMWSPYAEQPHPPARSDPPDGRFFILNGIIMVKFGLSLGVPSHLSRRSHHTRVRVSHTGYEFSCSLYFVAGHL